ncbi:ribosome recycling factor [Spiroplasma chinense]|uniref:Ribosome-recycling factor n=1 Tax=Spiroplasma chinense TaxID=216932 RepID=A0A5B9Y4A4_9MOLU|nr:ribosome recycling factor [Spiroplasma chinense]QEH61593.1 ribosome recycling factor [Spiroplasma chinense]
MIKDILENVELEMASTIESFNDYLLKVRTGRANANMLKGVMVDFYGTLTPIEQTSQISSPEPQQLVVKPYDRSQIGSIISGINKADLGLNPMSEADLVRINIPSLTEETRKDLVKKVFKELEQFKVRIRNLRRDANDQIKKADVTEDDKKFGESEVQKLTDKFVAQLDSVAKAKEKDLMSI